MRQKMRLEISEEDLTVAPARVAEAAEGVSLDSSVRDHGTTGTTTCVEEVDLSSS